MKYRIVLKVGYNEAHFEFNDVWSASDFAKEILLHSVKSEDTDKKTNVRIEALLDEKNNEEDTNG